MDTGSSFERAFAGPLGGGVRFNYAVTRDGERFLIVTEAEETPGDDRIVVANWDAAPEVQSSNENPGKEVFRVGFRLPPPRKT